MDFFKSNSEDITYNNLLAFFRVLIFNFFS